MNSYSKDPGEMKKFLFNTRDFDKTKQEAAPPPPTFTEEQLEQVRQEAYAHGKRDGLAEATQLLEEKISRNIQKIAALVENLMAQEDRREIEKCTDATRLAMRVTHKLLPQFAKRYAIEEIERIVVSSIEARRDEPRMVVIIPTMHLESLRERIDPVAHEKGFAGKVILLADDNLGISDCRVEWADGGAERLYERLFSQIESEFAKAIAGMNTALETEKV